MSLNLPALGSCSAISNGCEMWKQIRSWFGGTSVSRKSGDDFEAIKSDVEHVLRLDLSSESVRESNGEMVFGALKRLDVAVEDIRQQADGYPAKPISGAVWINGVGYANLACADAAFQAGRLAPARRKCQRVMGQGHACGLFALPSSGWPSHACERRLPRPAWQRRAGNRNVQRRRQGFCLYRRKLVGRERSAD